MDAKDFIIPPVPAAALAMRRIISEELVKGLTFKSIAKEMRVDVSTVVNWFNGSEFPDEKTFKNIRLSLNK